MSRIPVTSGNVPRGMLRALFHLHRVEVVNATALYPKGLVWDLRPGLNVVVGGTGLGKTTLLNASLFGLFGSIGQGTNRVEHLATPEYFRSRMLPGGAPSKSKPLLVRTSAVFGRTNFDVERSLATGSLVSVRRGKSKLSNEEYDDAVASALGAESFRDHVVRLVEHLLYVSDEHYLLSWDPQIQNEILQLLFIGTKAFNEVHSLWNQALQADSLFRNARYQAHLVQKELDALTLSDQGISDDNSDSIPARRAELFSVRERSERLRDEARERLDTEREAFRALEVELDGLRTKFQMLAEAMYASADVSLDARLRDAAVAAAPEDSTRAVLARFLTATAGLACPSCAQTPVKQTAAMKTSLDALLQSKCPVCTLDMPKAPKVKPRSKAKDPDVEMTALADDVLSATAKMEAARSRAFVFEEEYRRAETASLAAARAEYEFAVAHPPQGGSVAAQKKVALDALRSRQLEYQQQLENKLARFKSAQEKTAGRLESLYENLSEHFAYYARLFLDEPCTVEFDPEGARATRRGAQIDPPHAAFYPVINGAPRYRSEHLSEAQRLFIDLAFRMALLELWREETQGTATLVVETPEGTVDMAYMIRVAQMLRAFASKGHTVIVTTNLNNEAFLPELLASTPKSERGERILNLIELGNPRPIQRAQKRWFDRVIKIALDRPKERE